MLNEAEPMTALAIKAMGHIPGDATTATGPGKAFSGAHGNSALKYH